MSRCSVTGKMPWYWPWHPRHSGYPSDPLLHSIRYKYSPLYITYWRCTVQKVHILQICIACSWISIFAVFLPPFFHLSLKLQSLRNISLAQPKNSHSFYSYKKMHSSYRRQKKNPKSLSGFVCISWRKLDEEMLEGVTLYSMCDNGASIHVHNSPMVSLHKSATP